MNGRLLVGCLIVLAVLPGCGYQAGSLITPDVQSVHVQVFDNRDFRHEIEVPLTEAVKNEITRRTHLKIRGPDTADTVLRGTIKKVSASVTAYDTDDEVFSQSVTVRVEFEWRRRDNDQLLASASDLGSSAQLLALRGETQGTATSETFRDLAELIVERMEEDF